ncbi:chemotaxis protein CheW [Actinokineospora enzanensis]|uniref:chemotaxis protein CheW n=1 Tax=Actinokineospora enzanensis TaxID=155975 RepID=UPI000381A91A|nr:chemotaxis protein CheW [Actinokineospora enzanensis]
MTDIDALYGVFAVDGKRVALPLARLREVIPAPAALDPMPTRQPAVRGAVNLRHLAIPVLSLRDLFGGAAAPGPEVIVVAAHDGHVIGLLADEILGVETVEADALFHMRTAGEHVLFSTGFEQADGALVSVLDFDAVTTLPDVPAVRDRGRDDVNAHRRAIDGTMRTVLLLSGGETRLCVGVDHVHSVVPDLRVTPSAVARGVCLGVAEVGEYTVAVVDTLALLGLGSLGATTSMRGVCLRLPRGMVVLAVEDVTNVASVAAQDIMAAPASVRASMPLLAGTLSDGAVQRLVIDDAAVVADENVRSLGAVTMTTAAAPPVVRELSDSGRDDQSGGRKIRERVRPMLTFQAGIEAATDLLRVSEVIEYPADVLAVNSPEIHGLFTHRGVAVPLIRLADVLERPAPVGATDKVLLVGTGGDLVGFVVSALHAIEDSIWEEVLPDGPRRSFPLVRVTGDGHPRTLPEIDLLELAGRHHAPAARHTAA